MWDKVKAEVGVAWDWFKGLILSNKPAMTGCVIGLAIGAYAGYHVCKWAIR